jgi:xanthine dehydrogenase accessory factor
MAARIDLADRAAGLAAAGSSFVWATVVRAERPTSAKPGDAALILADGSIEGFVGGDCAESTVRMQALEVLASGQPRLLRITPDGTGEEEHAGVVSVHNPCLSGGTLEIFLEPATPLPVVAVFGDGPIAEALLRAHGLLGQQVVSIQGLDEPLPADLQAVVVASHGHDEAPILEAALRAGVPYVALVASRRRGPAVLASLAVDDGLRARVRSPAGLDIGARTAPEVALSILAEVVEALRGAEAVEPTGVELAMADAEPVRDPVCGMLVAPVAASPQVSTPGGTVYFCGTGCRTAYLANPAAYAS